jgi:hypothetical protein
MAKKRKRYSKKSTPASIKTDSHPLKWLQTHKNTILLSIFLTYILSGTTHFSTELSIIGDNAQFVVLGQSLAEGKGYKEINRPNPSDHTKYPFGFPVLLALSYHIFHLNYLGYKIIIFLFSIGALYFLYRWFEGYSLIFLFSFLVMIALNLKILEYSSLILSEGPFLFFVTLGFYLLDKFDKLKKYQYFILGILSWGIAYYMRSIGIVLFLAFFLYLLLRKKYKLAIVWIFVTTIIITPWQLWTSIHGGASYFKALQMKNPYSPHLGKIGFSEIVTQRIPTNFKGYFLTFVPETIIPLFKAQKFALKNMLGGILTLSVLAGFIFDFWKKWDLKGWYFLGTIAVLLLWPEVWMGERFLFGIIPLIIFYFIYCVHQLTKKLTSSERKLNSLFSKIIMVFIAILIIMQLNFKNPQTQYTHDWINYKKCAIWIKENISSDATIVCRKPFLAYLWIGKKTTSIPATSKKEEVYKRFINEGATHIIFDGFYWSSTTRRRLGPIIQKNQSDFPVVYALRNPYTYVLEFKPATAIRDSIQQ